MNTHLVMRSLKYMFTRVGVRTWILIRSITDQLMYRLRQPTERALVYLLTASVTLTTLVTMGIISMLWLSDLVYPTLVRLTT